MNAAVQRLEAVPGRRVVAVSDVHGNLPLLKGLLETVSLCGEDLLLLVGDIVEKGPQSLATLRYLLDLRRRVPVAGVIGNCDLGVLQALDEEDAFRSLLALRQKHQLPGLLQEMLEKQGLVPGEAEDVRPCLRLLNERYREELAFLRGLPTVLSAPHHLFVHAGLPTADEAALPACPVRSCVKRDAFLDQGLAFPKWVVVGHWPVALYREDFPCNAPLVSREARVLSIDGGNVLREDGQLNALLLPDLNREDFAFAAYDGLPRARVRDAQAASTRSFHLRWIDNAVDILSETGDVARIRHRRTGYEMDVLRSLLFSREPDVRCLDVTDYRLPLRPGDVVSVLDREPCSLGRRVKKDGVCGWYAGRLDFLDE